MAESAAVHRDREIIPGTDFVVDIAMQDDDGNARDLTGSTITMQGRPTADDGTTLFNVSTADTIVHGGTAGTITATVPGASTASINQGGVYDMLVEFASGKLEVPITGDLNYHPRVTR